jgi:transposase-like protein
MNIREAHEKFSSDEDCLQYIQQMRWPDGVVRCPSCGEKNVKRVERTAESKNRRKWFYLCLEKTCHNQFTPTSGTLFADTHLPLIVWFQAITLMLNAKKGISAKQLQRDLGIGGYKTAWYLNHRIREAMNQGDIPMLGGTVEVDETYVGGKQKGKGIWYGKNQKKVVIGMKQRGGDLKMFHTPNAQTGIIKPLVEKHIDAAKVDEIMTDEFVVYPIVFKGTILAEKHRTIQHKERKYVVGTTHTNGIESAFSLFKRGIIGSFHQVSRKHMQRYLDEFTFRFNRRKDDGAFAETVCRLAGFAPLTFAALTSEKV